MTLYIFRGMSPSSGIHRKKKIKFFQLSLLYLDMFHQEPTPFSLKKKKKTTNFDFTFNRHIREFNENEIARFT